MGVATPFGAFELGRTGALTAGTHGGIVGGMSPFGITWKEGALTKVFAGNVAARVNNMVKYESPELSGFNFTPNTQTVSTMTMSFPHRRIVTSL